MTVPEGDGRIEMGSYFFRSGVPGLSGAPDLDLGLKEASLLNTGAIVTSKT